MVPLKRRKLVSSHAGNAEAEGSGAAVKFPSVVIFLLERKMGASRRTFLSQLGRSKGFKVEELFSERITHVISENNYINEVRTWLDSHIRGQSLQPAHLLDISWYTESMRAGRPVEILERHKLQEQQINEAAAVVFSVPSYACQRRTTLQNHNTVLTEALSLLAENAELNEEDGRAIAFRRSEAVLKALPKAVTNLADLRGLPCLGEHSLKIIKDVLKDGVSSEVETTRQSDRYKALKVLTGIFGVGAKTADRWIKMGISTLHQLQASGQTLNQAQQAGLEHYEDLNQPVAKAEADAIGDVVQKVVLSVLPGALITLIGGFRRGKPTGHDVDFLITHPEEGREVGLLPKVASLLKSQGFLLYQKTTRNSYLESDDGPARLSSNMDRFERCFSIFKLEMNPGTTRSGTPRSSSRTESQSDDHSPQTPGEVHENGLESRRRSWRAVRVDLVVSPISQFAFALLGWTGSKLFEREMRRWAGHEKAMSLSSHALYDTKQRRYLRAASEEEIFAHLGLEYIPPSQRNA
eukprot:XP_003965471.1 PREDICTED: DNA-directed DNA/RNA polymerase mu [Takifugu rubripes]